MTASAQHAADRRPQVARSNDAAVSPEVSAEERIAERRFSASRFGLSVNDEFDEADDAADAPRETAASVAPAWDTLPSVAAPTLSLEVFPARGVPQLRRNVTAVRKLLKLGPDFVTVTYGAAGSRQAGTKELVTWIAQSGVPTYAHLTCQATSLRELDETIDELLEARVTGILALRGDARDDGSGLVLPHATDLITRVRQRAEAAGQRIRIVVAAFPTGHPDSRDLREDAENVARKQQAGADFAITQHFFDAEDYTRFLDLVAATGATLPIVPGLTPTTTVRRLERISELSGLTPPPALAAALQAAPDAQTRRDIAVQNTVELAEKLARAGAPGIQLFTMNDEPTALRVFDALSTSPAGALGQNTGREPWLLNTQGPALKAALH
ncbi:methylenetetrahydrofolate reductase [Pseudoclavibacter sp. 13-3]|uniref:methylenetetrahydrofolate reductase n=1 Tax=Pseudoclavibacter sp. 13-3 TaxID=2901228 RepID=UPI001E41CF6A|nr:methylenetetrahydrofolate reductase [Pseudoclavibacter sp. 13-3]MCD7101382.1 methylenetetrahydrofolate reductase [Pseudoclavibacter sp. 13-3]